MKKLMVFILSLALLLSLCSCSGSKDSELLRGTYIAVEAYLDENEISLESMFPEGFSITLRKGGNCEFHINSGRYLGSWRCIGSSFWAEGAGAVLEGSIGDGSILLKGVLGSDVSLRLVCEDIANRVNQELLSRASTYDYTGCWLCREYYFSSDSDDAFIRPGLFSCDTPFSFELADSGNALYVCGNEGRSASWDTNSSGFSLYIGEHTLYFALSAENQVCCEGDGYKLYFERTFERPASFGACDILYYSSAFSSFPIVSFSSDSAAQMSAFMLYGRYAIESDILYGTFHNRQGVPQFASASLLCSGGVLVPGSPVLIDADCQASYISIYNGRLYYIRSSFSDNSVSAVSCLPDGSDSFTLYDGDCKYLQFHGDRIWFTDSDGHLISCLPDGTDRIIHDAPSQVFTPYFIDNCRLIYQSGTDGQRLHLFNLDSGEDIRLTYHAAMNPVISGTDLYYTTPVTGESFFHLCKLDLSFAFSRYDELVNSYIPVWNYEESSAKCSSRFAVSGDGIISYDAVEYPLSLWMTLEDSSWQQRSLVPQFVSENYIVSFVYDSDSMVSQILVTSLRLNDSAALPRL